MTQSEMPEPKAASSFPAVERRRVGRKRRPNAVFIAGMWFVTILAWASGLLISPLLAVSLDLWAVILAVLLTIRRGRVNRINGWVKLCLDIPAFILIFLRESSP